MDDPRENMDKLFQNRDQTEEVNEEKFETENSYFDSVEFKNNDFHVHVNENMEIQTINIKQEPDNKDYGSPISNVFKDYFKIENYGSNNEKIDFAKTNIKIESNDFDTDIGDLEIPFNHDSITLETTDLENENHTHTCTTNSDIYVNQCGIKILENGLKSQKTDLNIANCSSNDETIELNNKEKGSRSELFKKGITITRELREASNTDHETNVTLVTRQPETIFYQGSQVCQITQNNFCQTCNKWFSSLDDHVNEHMSSDKDTQTKCKDFSNSKPMKIKKIIQLSEDRTTQTDKKHYACTLCDKSFALELVLRQHMSTHDKRTSCTICNKDFSTASKLTAHMRTHTDERPFNCYTCCKRFKSRGSLQKHILVHSDNHRFKCSLCDHHIGFTSEDYLRKHMLAHKYKCSLCNKHWKSQSQLNFHLSVCDKNKDIITDKGISALDHLNEHMSSDKDTQAEGKDSSKDSDSAGTLSEGMTIHTDKNQFKCTLCDKSFAQELLLRQHKSTHYNMTCTICNEDFSTPSQLNEHMLTHADEFPFNCNVCNKRFKLQYMLKRHSYVHTDYRPFKCSSCDHHKGFISKFYQKQHMLSHKYKCSLCNRHWKSQSQLNVHMTLCDKNKDII